MKARKPIVIANWKLNGGPDLICSSVASFIGKQFPIDIALCPPSLYLRDMQTFLQHSAVKLGSQNVSRYESGAYTGEVSAKMLKAAGVELCIIGHSERRAIFAETDSDCQAKVQAALKQGLLAVLCIGETQAERAANATNRVLLTQLSQALNTLTITGDDLCIAYEPVWAIGSGLAATPEMVQETHQFIRAELAKLYTPDIANRARIIYGGSVNKTNTSELLKQKDIDGLLVGGASLDPEHFLTICEKVSELALA